MLAESKRSIALSWWVDGMRWDDQKTPQKLTREFTPIQVTTFILNRNSHKWQPYVVLYVSEFTFFSPLTWRLDKVGWVGPVIWKLELCLSAIQWLHSIYNHSCYICGKLIFMRFRNLKKSCSHFKSSFKPKIDWCSNWFGIIGTKERSLNNSLIWKKNCFFFFFLNKEQFVSDNRQHMETWNL